VEQKRFALEERRRQEAEQKKAEMRSHEESLKKRIAIAKGRDRKALGADVEMKRKALEKEER